MAKLSFEAFWDTYEGWVWQSYYELGMNYEADSDIERYFEDCYFDYLANPPSWKGRENDALFFTKQVVKK